MLPVRHWTSTAHLQDLEKLGCLVLYEVDVHNMNEHPDLKQMKFDVILFNFPHAGHYSWLHERDSILIRMHQDLIAAYFKTAKEMVQEEGEIHVTVRDDDPYNTWEVEKLAECAGLQLKDKVEFRQENYPGYHNKRGGNINCNKKFPLKACYTYKFTLKVSAVETSDGSEVNDSASSEVTCIITTVEDLQI
ncbi:heavy metal-associated isoprenylated plant protein 41-like [Coffea eugenioides]|uniref:heavy metal-associated isoprenylated plant protein 41-like n=1 Tax=Coffea eugenioides TaxID=49369 RepID=UPI000F609D0E|nr:heavy metal-associated isoprenylated plant protein 41-like [Coffea eugenioides]